MPIVESRVIQQRLQTRYYGPYPYWKILARAQMRHASRARAISAYSA